jgi:hypothetical protein
MALTLGEIEAQIDALETAKATGQLSIAYDDKRVQYRDLAEIDSTLQWLYRKRGELTGRRAGARQIRMVTSDGYGR